MGTTTGLIVPDFSNGNAAVILEGAGTLANLTGKPVGLVELLLSHDTPARALDSVGFRCGGR
ncbi:MAG: hypothetical protein AAF366_11130 [Pseudomonadota bacterium]